MNLDLKSEKINYVKPIFSRRFSHEEILEVIVPDAQPDVLRVVNTEGVPYLRSKDADTGRVTATGVVECVVLYIPEDGEGLRKLEINVPYTVSADGGEITADSLIVAEITVSAADTKMLNSRKLLVKAELWCTLTCYAPCSFFLSRAKELQDIFVRSEQKTLLLPSAVSEKTFIFTDEVRLKTGVEPIGDILRARVTLACDEIKPVGRKAVVKGNAFTEVAYSLKESAVIQLERFTTPFSQIVETDAETEPSKFTASLMLTSAYISRSFLEEAGSDCLNLEIHAVAQCTAYSELELSYISDVYSPKYEVTPTSRGLKFQCLEDSSDFSDTVKGVLPAENPDSVRLLTVAPAQVVCTGEGPTTVTVMLNAAVVYEDRSGALWQTVKKLECRRDFEFPVESGDVAVSCGECFSAVNGSEIELRVPVSVSVRRQSGVELEVIEELAYDETAPCEAKELPSITVIRAGERCCLWEVAKKYGSSIDLITAMNELSTETAVSVEPSVSAGEILLVPRIR